MSGFLAGAIVAKLMLDKTGWNQSVDGVKGDEKKLTESAKNIDASFTQLGTRMALAGAAITAAILGTVQATATYGDKIDELSQKVGINAETLQSLRLIAEKSGTSLEGMATGLGILSRNMVDAAGGSAQAQQKFDLLGISVFDATGKLKDTDAMLMALAERFSTMPDGPIKTAAAMELLGRSGKDMIPFLNEGAEGMRNQMERARELGLVMGKDGVKASRDFADAQDELKLATGAVGRTIGETLLPMITDFMKKTTDIVAGIRKWTEAHPELAKAISGTALTFGGLLTVGGALLILIPKIKLAFGGLSDFFGIGRIQAILMGTALIALAATIAYYIQLRGQVSVAENYAIEAGKRLHDTQMKLIDKLSEAAVAAGFHYGQMSKLIDVYDGNIAALVMAIRKGEVKNLTDAETIAIQKALAEVGKKHNAVLEAQAKALEEANQKMVNAAKIAAEAKKALEEWTNFLTAAGIQTALTASETDKYAGYARELDKLLKAGKISQEDYAKGILAVNSALEPFGRYVAAGSIAMATATGKGRDLFSLMHAMPKELDSTGYAFDTLDDKLDAMAYGMGISTTTLKAYIYELQRLQLGILGFKLPPFPGWPKDEIKTAVTDPVSEAFAGLYNNIAQGFGDTFQTFIETWSIDKLLKMDIDFKEFFKDLWGNIKESFFTMVGEIATKWVKGLLEDIFIKKTKEAAISAGESIAGVGTSVTTLGTTVAGIAGAIATVITTLATAIATAIGTIAVGLATALVTLATAIATAATILAAAAVPLLIVGAIAIAIFAGFKAIESLFGGGGGKQTDVTYWLKLMWADGKELHDWVINLPAAYFNTWHNFFFNMEWATRETVTVLYAIKDFLGPMLSALQSIDGQISNLREAASGAISTQTEMLVVHGTPSIPEITMPLPGLKTLIAEGGPRNGNGGAVILQAEFNVQTLDADSFRETVRKKIGPEIVEWIRTNVGKRLIADALGV